MKRNNGKRITSLLSLCLMLSLCLNLLSGINLVFADGTSTDDTEDYITSGGFDDATECFESAWNYSDYDTDLVSLSCSQDDSNVQEGTGALNVWINDAGTSSQEISLQQNIETIPSGTYEISVQVMGEGIQAAVFSGTDSSSAVSGSAITVTTWGTWEEITQTVTVDETTEDYLVGLDLSGDPGAYCYIDSFTMTTVEPYEIEVPNGDFESGNTSNWTVETADSDSSYTYSVKDGSLADVTGNYMYGIWNNHSDSIDFCMSTTITGLEAGVYKASVDADGQGESTAPCQSGLSLVADVSDTLTSSDIISTEGWNNFITTETPSFSVDETGTVTLKITGSVAANNYWMDLDNVTLYKLDGAPTETSTAVDASITVNKIDGLSEDFIRGVDISSLVSLENSGVTFKDADGNEQDIFTTLKDAGVNYIRVRVWNNPYDEDGNGYGGGNCDIETAIELGKRATAVGMKLLVDFHYSDFWADPSRQLAPKAWEDYTVSEKATALYDYTYDCLQQLMDAGVDVGMVQIGNETNNAICGVSDTTDMCTLFNAGSSAVRAIASENNHDILVAVHFTDPNDPSKYTSLANTLETNNVDYDVFGFSYYPIWHGDTDTIKEALTTIAEDYGKKVMVAETSYPYTLDDTDGWANTISSSDELTDGYTASVQGQANELTDVIEAIASVGDLGIGVFYWEPAWITVSSTNTLEENEEIWETYGSGWASSYASDYDPDNVGEWYGGSAVDNQCLFDKNGVPLDSLNTFKYIYTGSIATLAVDYYSSTSLSVIMGNTISWPETVTAVYNDRTTSEIAVTWDSSEMEAVEEVNASKDNSLAGIYTVSGITSAGDDVTCTITISNYNYVQNYSFEDTDDTSMWNITYLGTADQADYQYKASDAKTGNYSLHYWSSDEVNFTCEQTITDLPAGYYDFSAWIQGGDAGDSQNMYLYAIVDGVTYTQATSVSSWCEWSNDCLENLLITNGEVTVGIAVQCAAGGWGSIDDFYLWKIGDYTANSGSSSGSSNISTPATSTTTSEETEEEDEDTDEVTDEMIQAYVDSISISIPENTLYIGGTEGKQTQVAISVPTDETSLKVADAAPMKVSYSTSDTSVALISKAGTIRAKGVGDTTITVSVSVGDLTKEFSQTITVKKAYIEIVKRAKKMSVGNTYTFTAIGHGVSTDDITWTTTKKKIVVIKKNTGVATAKTSGKDTVVASVGKIKCKVTVKVSK